MKGTEKQIKWAEDIKRSVFATLDNADAQRGNRFYNIDQDLSYLSPEAVTALRAEYAAGFDRVEDAAWIIDRRDAFSPAKVIKHGRDWMWIHGQKNSRGQLLR